MFSRRTVLSGAAAALGAGPLASCGIEAPEIEVSRDPGPTTAAPVDPKGFLDLAELASPPVTIEVAGPTMSSNSSGEIWARELELTGPAAEVEGWIVVSYGSSEAVARAWVTPEDVRTAMGIDAVPDTWRLEHVSVAGTPYQRIVLVDDADPTRVRIRLAEVDV